MWEVCGSCEFCCEILTPQEAKLAWANGQELQYYYGCEWSDLEVYHPLSTLSEYAIRLKPQEVHIDVRLPKPFVPEIGEQYFRVSATRVLECTRTGCLDDSRYTIGLGCYRTLEEACRVFDIISNAIHGDTNEVASQ